MLRWLLPLAAALSHAEELTRLDSVVASHTSLLEVGVLSDVAEQSSNMAATVAQLHEGKHFPRHLEVSFRALDREFKLSMRRNDELLGPNFRAEVLHQGGSRKLDQAHTQAACDYVGTVRTGDDEGHVRASLCQGMHATMYVLGDTFQVTPAASHKRLDGEYRVWQDDGAQYQDATCGVTHGSNVMDMRHPIPLNQGAHQQPGVLISSNGEIVQVEEGVHLLQSSTSIHYVEFWLWIDYWYWQYAGGSGSDAEKQANAVTRAKRIVNELAGIYSAEQWSQSGITRRINIVLAGISVLPTPEATDNLFGCTNVAVDPSECNLDDSRKPSEADVDKLLPNFHELRQKEGRPHDNGHLLSGQEFSGSTVGYANVGTMCSTTYSGGITQGTFDNDVYVASVMAHEIGHNFGMYHDSKDTGCNANDYRCNDCPKEGYVMAAVGCSSCGAITDFSTCSRDYLFQAWSQSGFQCLDNEPAVSIGNAVCGNGILEDGEQCDCGFDDCTGIDECCEGRTCLLKPEAECPSSAPCCNPNTCKPYAAIDEVTCRPKDGDNTCDVHAEMCDGTSAECPVDLRALAGQSCTDTKGRGGKCYDGVCITLDNACEAADGSGSRSCGFTSCNADLQCKPSALAPPTSCAAVPVSTSSGSGGNTPVPNGAGCSLVPSDVCVNGICANATAAAVARWVAHPWSPCPVQCGSAQQNRTVTCQLWDGTVLNDSHCSGSDKPSTDRPCGMGCDACDTEVVNVMCEATAMCVPCDVIGLDLYSCHNPGYRCVCTDGYYGDYCQLAPYFSGQKVGVIDNSVFKEVTTLPKGAAMQLEWTSFGTMRTVALWLKRTDDDLHWPVYMSDGPVSNDQISSRQNVSDATRATHTWKIPANLPVGKYQPQVSYSPRAQTGYFDTVEITCDDAVTCGGHGTCDTNGMCVCNPGFSGPDCNPKCSTPGYCGGHGVCNQDSGQCVCSDNWTGERCGTPPANLSCPATTCNAGVLADCDETGGTCDCTYARETAGFFGGATCSKCQLSCGNGGSLPEGTCKQCRCTHEHWTGPECRRREYHMELAIKEANFDRTQGVYADTFVPALKVDVMTMLRTAISGVFRDQAAEHVRYLDASNHASRIIVRLRLATFYSDSTPEPAAQFAAWKSSINSSVSDPNSKIFRGAVIRHLDTSMNDESRGFENGVRWCDPATTNCELDWPDETMLDKILLYGGIALSVCVVAAALYCCFCMNRRQKRLERVARANRQQETATRALQRSLSDKNAGQGGVQMSSVSQSSASPRAHAPRQSRRSQREQPAMVIAEDDPSLKERRISL